MDSLVRSSIRSASCFFFFFAFLSVYLVSIFVNFVAIMSMIFLQQCDSNNIHRWTYNNNLRCSDYNSLTKDDRCRSGYCKGTPYNCLSCEQHDGRGCPIKPGYCIIQKGNQRTCYAKNQYKPGNPCQVKYGLSQGLPLQVYPIQSISCRQLMLLLYRSLYNDVNATVL